MGQNVFFSSGFVYSWRSGWGTPGKMRVAQAAQGSAALPGAFSVVSLPLKRFGLPRKAGSRRKAASSDQIQTARRRRVRQHGHEWLLNIGDRLRDGTPPVSLKPVDEAIVVNASAGDDVIQRRWLTKPFIGDIASLLAVEDVMYRQTAAVRRRLLDVCATASHRIFDSIQPDARVLRNALRGTTIQIDRSPF